MLIYFKEDDVTINTENVSSIECFIYDGRPCLFFSVTGDGAKDIHILFPAKEDAFKVLDTILTAYNTQQKVLIIHNKKMGG